MKRPRLLTALATVGLALSGCAAITASPERMTAAARDQMFPAQPLDVQKPVRIYWNAHRVPFVEAQNDDDLAFAIGLVHAHLRGGQLEVFRMVSQGRAAEMAGAPAVDLDKTLRIIDMGAAVPDIIAQMKPETRQWTERYIDGLNAFRVEVVDVGIE
ncbi:MAG: penicillin acylase family protein, partial [Myxococcota bacterium]